MSDRQFDRRQLMIGTTTILGTAAFLHACGGSAYIRERPMPTFAVPEGEPPIVTALRFGITAPSAHNTQPWKLEVLSDYEARLYLDTERQLPETDPPARQIHMSHGTLLEVVHLAAPRLGYRAELGLLPEGEITRADFGRKPTAHIRLEEDASAPVDPLVDAFTIRRTSRLEHHPEPLGDDEISDICTAATLAGVTPDVRTRDREALADLAVRAMQVEVDGDDTYYETREWFRFSADEVVAHGDGLNLQTAGADSWLARTFLTPKNFGSPANRRRFMASFDETLRTTRGFFTLQTPTNTMHDWLMAGRAYVRGQLAAALHGLRFHPVSQALQEFAAMDALRAELNGLVGVSAPAKLQMFVRVGRTEKPAVSPRRPLEQILKA